MKKSILAIAVASLAVSTAALAEPTVYGNVHLSLNAADNDLPDQENNLSVSSNTSAIGAKGSEDLGDGLKAIYKVEWAINIGPSPTTIPDDGFVGAASAADGVGNLVGRDQFVGLKGGWGTIKFGTMSSNYKQMGSKVDALYRTPMEGRAFIKTQSNLHGGKAINRGRQTHTAQYVSPKMAGVQLVANTTFSGSNDESMGIGLRWSNKAFLAYADYYNSQTGATSNITDPGTGIVVIPKGDAVVDCSAANNCSMESAWKVGGKFTADVWSLAAQYESAADRVGADYLHTQATFNINKNNMFALTYGMQDVDNSENDSVGYALAYDHKMSKMTNVYVAYGARADDAPNKDESMLSFGIRKKF
jgi:predicted porin